MPTLLFAGETPALPGTALPCQGNAGLPTFDVSTRSANFKRLAAASSSCLSGGSRIGLAYAIVIKCAKTG